MNRRICAFKHNEKYYISQEFNGDREEQGMWQLNPSIPCNWLDVIGTFNGSETLDDFISAVHSMENAYGYSHEELEIVDELPKVQEVWLLKEGQLQLYAKYGELVSSIEANKLLAERLNDFYKDFDHYDYMDKLNGTEEDAVEGLARQLEDSGAVSGILDALADIKENGALSDDQRLVVDELVLDLSEVQVNLGKSIGDVIAEAVGRSNDSKADKMVIDILQVKSGDEYRYHRFAPVRYLESGLNEVEAKSYNHIYHYSDEEAINLSDVNAVMDLLEKVYTRFNVWHPDDFKGHSLSVSDVVVLTRGKESKAYYCDSFGFEALPDTFVKDFLSEKSKTERQILMED